MRVTPDDRVSNVSFMDHLHEITFCVFHLRKYDFIFGPNRKMNSQNAFKYLFAESALVFFFFSIKETTPKKNENKRGWSKGKEGEWGRRGRDKNDF